MTTAKDRMTKLCEELNISRRAFQKTIGVSPTYIINMVDKPTDKVLRKIKSKYPYINTDWILTGNGNMFLETPVNFTNVNSFPFRKAKNSNEGVAEHVGDNIGTANLDIIAAQSAQIDRLIEQGAKKDEQIEKLIALLTSKMIN